MPTPDSEGLWCCPIFPAHCGAQRRQKMKRILLWTRYILGYKTGNFSPPLQEVRKGTALNDTTQQWSTCSVVQNYKQNNKTHEPGTGPGTLEINEINPANRGFSPLPGIRRPPKRRVELIPRTLNPHPPY